MHVPDAAAPSDLMDSLYLSDDDTCTEYGSDTEDLSDLLDSLDLSDESGPEIEQGPGGGSCSVKPQLFDGNA